MKERKKTTSPVLSILGRNSLLLTMCWFTEPQASSVGTGGSAQQLRVLVAHEEVALLPSIHMATPAFCNSRCRGHLALADKRHSGDVYKYVEAEYSDKSFLIS